MSSVDVIVPCYRYAHFLRQCVESVLTQSTRDIRILIIDDASPDHTAEIARELALEDSRVSFIRHAKNIGHIRTYNEGLDWACSDYVLILSADDYLLPDALRYATALMDTHPDAAFVFGKAMVLTDGQSLPQVDSELSVKTAAALDRVVAGLDFIALSGSANIVETPTAVVRTSFQKRVGGYRAELPHSGDMEMWLRLAAHGSVGVLDRYQAVYRRHSANMNLQYMAKHRLPDLHQRKAALDYFFIKCGHLLPNAEQLHREMFWNLGCSAIGSASSAFNEGDQEAYDQSVDFALGICPEIKQSWPWMKLLWKRILGRRVWDTVRPALTRSRQACSHWRRL